MASTLEQGSQIVEKSLLPSHVAIIMDGNGRWAQQRGKPRVMGHRSGIASVRAVIESSARKQIDVLTLFAFSSENWRRPQDEVGLLMKLFIEAIQSEGKKLHENRVRLRVIGDVSAFSQPLQDQIAEIETLTQNNDGLLVNIAANYGGHWEIIQAVRQLADQVKSGEIDVADINNELITKSLALGDVVPPDLFIRTGGEQRISNFLLWHLAYTELYFTDTLWPDFDDDAYDLALECFAGRQRRFGRIAEQLGSDKV
ncbi:MAG: di-trans,poly-cis-decaprenylcistransferase [Gammaproteobacteria bacterium]|nr:di-trans,poly-cis-decaprenylcistransferase [Gammaproteobacteria bacterium]